MNEVRLGVIGCGGMARSAHMKLFPEVKRLKFTAATDISEENLKATAEAHPHVKIFTDADQMMGSGLVDAVFIATPHYFHPPYAIAALNRGLHVMTEKPVAVTAKAAAEVNQVAGKHPQLRYGVMHQMRTAPVYRKAHELIKSGRLGEIQRVQWTITNWFRTQAYYNSGDWRATWAGEGGGVLLNQCPHNLDILFWLCGQPKRISAHLTLGKYHDIEVEDDVTALFQYPNGATGVFITSTGESPGTDFFEIVGDRGKLVIGKELEFFENTESSRKVIRESTQRMGKVPTTRHLIQPSDDAGGGSGHTVIHQNFVDAILSPDVKLIAPGEEGLYSLEMVNAMIMSGLTSTPIELPMDRIAYDDLLTKLIREGKQRAGNRRATSS